MKQVLIRQGGAHYHTRRCSHVEAHESYERASLEDARARGIKPCRRCARGGGFFRRAKRVLAWRGPFSRRKR